MAEPQSKRMSTGFVEVQGEEYFYITNREKSTESMASTETIEIRR